MASLSLGCMWSTYKELFNVVDLAINSKNILSVQDLNNTLMSHLSDFLDLLKNPAKSTTDRNAVISASSQGLHIDGQSTTQILTADMIAEVLTISELFDLNEVAAVDLLLTGMNQQSYFPSLPHGLIAVLLYFDGKAALALCLKMLMQAREGRTWLATNLTSELSAVIHEFSKQIINNRLVSQILTLLAKFNEVDLLPRLQLPEFRAIGPPKHKHQVLEKIRLINSSLSSSLFYLSCQSGLTRHETLLLLGWLSTNQQETPSSALSDTTLAILMSLLYAIDARILDQGDSETWINVLPLLNDELFIPDVSKEIMSDKVWSGCAAIKAVVQFAWALSLLQMSSYIDLENMMDLIDGYIDYSISCDVFSTIKNHILTNESFFKEEYYVRKIHNLITDFIILLPVKVKEMRSQADESSRIILARQQENLDIPDNLPKDFQCFMELIHDMYAQDPLNLTLSNEYWCLSDMMANQQHQLSASFNSSFQASQLVQRQVTLFKFIRLAGDMLTPPLYVPYMNMLTGLSGNQQSAHCCFNLLSLNASATGSHASIVSWEHFLISLNNYYTNLRHEFTDGHHPLHQSVSMFPHQRHVITQQEVDGLMAVLRLLNIVANKDELARIALLKNNNKIILSVIFGLIGCAVPLKLKAELLNVLSSFLRSPEVAVDVWQLLHESKLFQCAGPDGSIVKKGIMIELDENEPKTEEYTMTRAFVCFISALLAHPLPSLATGNVAGSINNVPLLEFFKDYIFLKCNSRSFKQPVEKWQIFTSVLKVFHELVDSYDINKIILKGGLTSLHNFPAYSLLLHFYNDTQFLKTILLIIDESVQVLQKYISTPELPYIKSSSLISLKLIEMALSKQKMFMDSCMQMGGSSNFVGGGLDKLLMGVNPRTGKSDHLINVAKFIECSSYLPCHASCAINIFIQLIQSVYVQTKIVGILSANEDFSKSLLCGFSLCLENENFEVNDDIDELLDKDFTSPVSQVQLGESVLNLLIGSLNLPAPNMSHFLCGFDTKRHINKTMLHDPGINNFPRTCIHSVVSILNRSIDQPLKKHRHMYPRFYELAYQFIHCLCTDVNTCVPVLRYLRSHDFLYKQSSKLPFASVPNSTAKASASLSSSLLAQQSWLLSSLVVDLKVSADNKQRSYVQRVIELLLGVDVKSSSKMFLSDVCSTEQKDENKLQLLLSTISLSSDPPPPISHLNVFNPSQVQQISSMCEVLSSNNLTFCDVKTVYRILIEECSGLTGPLFSRREKALEEINDICSNIMQQNAHKRSVHANKQAFLAWRQAVEVILTVVPLQQFAGEKRLQVILDLLQSLLHKLMPDLNSIVSHQASYVILILVDNLARCFILHQSANQPFHSHGSSLQQDISVVRGRANEVVGMRSAYSTLLQTVLDGLIRYLLGSGSNGQRLRVHLYASLLYFLEIADKPQEFQHGVDQGIQRFLSPKENEYDKLSSDNLSTIKKYSEPLLSCLCRDICDGHDVTKMLSMSVLDKVLLIDTQKMWLNDVSSCGCIQHVTNGISADDHHLKLMLNPDPVPLKTLFIFQSKMSLLSRIARTREGANVLLSCDVMSHLAACSVLSLRPKHEGGYSYENSGFVPSILSRYRHHILFPIVRLSLTLISSLGSDNAAISKVFLFVMAHVETFTNIISMHPQDIRTMESLKELHLVVSLLSSIAHESIIEEVMLLDAMYGDVKMCLNRLQRPIINLLNRFSISGEQTSNMIKQIKNNLVHNYADHGDAFYDDDLNPDSSATDQSSDVGQKIMTIVEEILSNSLTLCRSIINESPVIGSVVLFSPQLSSCTEQKRYATFLGYEVVASKPSTIPSLATLVQLLIDSCRQYLVCLEFHNMFSGKSKENLHELSHREIKELSIPEKLLKSSQQKDCIIINRIATLLEMKSKELRLLTFIIENGLYLLWTHMEFYLVNGRSARSDISHLHFFKGSNETKTSDGFLMDAGLSEEDITIFKKESVTWMNEIFFESLLKVYKNQRKDSSSSGFIPALVRRLRRIITFYACKN